MEIETLLCVGCGKRIKIEFIQNNEFKEDFYSEKCNSFYVPIKFSYILPNVQQQKFNSNIFIVIDMRSEFKNTKPLFCKGR